MKHEMFTNSFRNITKVSKKIFTLLLGVFLTLQMNAQILDNSFRVIYDTWGGFEIELTTSFAIGSGSACPNLDSIFQYISNDTIYVEAYYLMSGVYPQLGCGQIDTIWSSYNTPISTVVVCVNGIADTTQAQQGPVVVTEPNASCAIGSPFPLSIEEQNKTKTLLKVTDMLGRNAKESKNTPLFYIYDDGTVEKKIIVE